MSNFDHAQSVSIGHPESLPLSQPREERFSAVRASQPAGALSRIRNGKRMVIGGFIVAVAGIVTYCIATFNGGMQSVDQTWSTSAPLQNGALLAIGTGTLLWLAGSVAYISGAMDADTGEASQE